MDHEARLYRLRAHTSRGRWFARRVPGVTLLRGRLSAEDRVIEGLPPERRITSPPAFSVVFLEVLVDLLDALRAIAFNSARLEDLLVDCAVIPSL